MVADNDTDASGQTPLEEQLAAISLSPSVNEATQSESSDLDVVSSAAVSAETGDAQASTLNTTEGSRNNHVDGHAAPSPQVQDEEKPVSDPSNIAAKKPAPSKTETYLLEHSPAFRRVHELREQGWSRPQGDAHFAKQRDRADNASNRDRHFFYDMMQTIGRDLHTSTNSALKIPSSSPSPFILDMCCAPGGFLALAIHLNPTASALGLTLPPSLGGHTLLIPETPRLEVRYIDITMLASNMGFPPESHTSIPASHPDAPNFLPRMFPPSQHFDLVFCDGQVLRTQARASYRAARDRERRRITLTQFVVGLEHVREGSTMVVLLHKLDEVDTVRWLREFERFASVRLYKHGKYHASRSAFYMVATGVRSGGEEVREVVRGWKREWGVATFGSEEEFEEDSKEVYGGAEEEVLREYGATLVEKGREVWEKQAKALERSPWMGGNRRRK